MSVLARQIADDIRERRPFEPREGDIATLEQAYRAQAEVTSILSAARPGRRIAGYKIAFNRLSSRDYYGLAEPCYAPIFSDEVYSSGVSLDRADFLDPVIEPEIAIRLAAPLTGSEDDAALRAAVAVFLPAIELMDVRGAFAHDPSAAAAVAQRIYSRGAVLGDGPARLAVDAAGIIARLTVDDAVTGEAKGAAPQPPLEALGWLNVRLAKDGLPLERGMVVLTGAHLPGFAIERPGPVTVDMEPLGSVSVTFI